MLSCVMSLASEFNISSETILRWFEREPVTGGELTAIPVYEYIGIDYGDPESGGLSLHANGWGRVDLGDGEYYEKDPDGYLLDGYVRYANPTTGLDVKLGRQHIYAGIVNDSVDGLEFQTYAGQHVSLLLYGGLPVGYEDLSGRSGDSLYGGRVALRQLFPGELGVSYKNLANDSDIVENKLGLDLSVLFLNTLAFSGLSCWNVETEAWAEHSYAANLYVKQFTLKASYEKFQYADYFSEGNGSRILDYLQGTDETLTVLGGDIVWQNFYSLDVGLKLKHYTYDLRQETSQYMAGVFNVYGQNRTAMGGELGSMDGDSSDNSYYLGRLYGYWDAPFGLSEKWFVDADIVIVKYREEIYAKDSSLFSSAGCGRTIVDDSLKIKISGDYSSDPYHDADLRLMTALIFEY
jgi:hypothetical protein